MRDLIGSLPREALEALLADIATRDPGVRGRVEALAAARAGTVDEKAVRSAVTRATAPPRDHTWRAGRAAAARAEDALELLRGLVDAAAPQAPRLVEHLIIRVDKLLGRVDDSGGYLGVVREHVRDLHLDACRAVPQPPAELAARLMHIAVTTEWDWVHDAPERYRDLLGDEGLAALDRQLVAARGREAPPEVGPLGWLRETQTASTLRYMAQSAARATGDVDRLIEILGEDLHSAHGYVKIAEALDAAGREREALVWLERGRDRYGTDDTRLRAGLLRAHLRDGNREDALVIAEEHLARRPSAAAFTELRDVCTEDLWPRRREAALTRIAEVSNDELVRALIADEAIPEALEAASRLPLHALTHQAIARAAAHLDPARALAHHRAVLEATLQPTGRESYRRAIAVLREMHTLATAHGCAHDVVEVAQDVRHRHHRRPALVQMLDKLGWW